MPAPVVRWIEGTGMSLSPVDASADVNAASLSSVGSDLGVPCQSAPSARFWLCLPGRLFAHPWGARSEEIRPAQERVRPFVRPFGERPPNDPERASGRT